MTTLNTNQNTKQRNDLGFELKQEATTNSLASRQFNVLLGTAAIILLTLVTILICVKL